MKRYVVGIVVAACLVMAGTAEALTVSSFTAHATRSTVFFKIHYCEAHGVRIHEHFNFYALDQPSGDFTDDSRFSIGGGCWTGSGQFANRYLGGLWELDLTMSDSGGALLHRSTRMFLP